MYIRPRAFDLKTIADNVGRVILAVGGAMAIPLVLSVSLGEWAPALNFLVGMLACFCFAAITRLTCHSEGDVSWISGMPSVGFAWLAAMFFAAIPLFLSGHYSSFLDACFESMSGLATTGLTLVQDLDHMSYGTNLWRHLIMFLGGQGIVLVVLAMFVNTSSWATEMYRGEAREDRIRPNIASTARFIWAVSLVYLVICTLMLWAASFFAGMPPAKGLFDSICIFIAGFDTGGFAPRSQGVIFYHSLWFEIAVIFTMLLGMINFSVHFRIWRGGRREFFRNVEMRTLAASLFTLLVLLTVGLARMNVYPDGVSAFRRGFFQLVSAHSGTGFMTVYGSHFLTIWGPLAFFALIIAMALGGASGSTSGGIKALRVNISIKSVWWDIRKVLSAPDSVLINRFHHLREVVVTGALVRGVMVVAACYLAAFIFGALVLTLLGYQLPGALFESTSATANVGLTCGITSPAMPWLAKVVFIIQMWAGRLEFISAFLLIRLLVVLVKGR